MDFEFSFLNFLYAMHSPALDGIMVFITHLGDKGILWILLGIAMIFTKKYRRAGFTVILALLMMLIIGNLTLKPLIARLRPYEYMDNIRLLIPTPADYSFPSGHTYASFAAAVSVFLFHKKEGAFALTLAVLISFSRLYLCVHFPTDVFAGFVLGVATAFVSKKICKLSLFAS